MGAGLCLQRSAEDFYWPWRPYFYAVPRL